MATASSSSFDDWIRSLLTEQQSDNADISDFVQYLMGIMTSDSETEEEKQTAIAELLAELDLKHDRNIDNLSEQILQRWHQSQNDTDQSFKSTQSRVATCEADDAINNALINAMNRIESDSKSQKQHGDGSSTRDVALKKHKNHILAKYSEVSDDELDYGDDAEATNNVLFHNTNAQDIEDREKKVRDAQQEAHKKQQEKNKVDSTNQKLKDEERKKKAQQRAQKQERRR